LSAEYILVTAAGLKDSSDLIWGRSEVTAKEAPQIIPPVIPVIRSITKKMSFFLLKFDVDIIIRFLAYNNSRRVEMSQGHNHHHHNHEVQSSLSFEEKMVKLLEHWIGHNEDHAKTYLDWAQKAKANDLAGIYPLLKDASETSLSINKKFAQAVRIIKRG